MKIHSHGNRTEGSRLREYFPEFLTVRVWPDLGKLLCLHVSVTVDIEHPSDQE
jgi:hypothetical protein